MTGSNSIVIAEAMQTKKSRVYLTQDSFIQKCEEIHKNKYDYSLVKYVNKKEKVSIICPVPWSI